MASDRMSAGGGEAVLVSVVIPLFNGADQVERTVRAVLSQTHRPLEVIVVDDGSTDGSADVVEATFGDDPAVRIIAQENLGVAAARNRGLEEANGPLVAFVDADDLWRPDKLARQVQAFADAGPECVAVYTWSANIDKDDVVIAPLRPKPAFRGEVLTPLLLHNFIGNASSPLMRTAAMKQVGGYSRELLARSGGQGFEDWHLYVKLAELGDFEVVPKFLTGYRQSGGSMSRRIKPFLANFREARRDIWHLRPDAPRRLYLWSELYLLSWMIGRAVAERRRVLPVTLAARCVIQTLAKDPLLPFRRETAAFYRYVREMRSHPPEPSPGRFTDRELVADLDRWQRTVDLRSEWLAELTR